MESDDLFVKPEEKKEEDDIFKVDQEIIQILVDDYFDEVIDAINVRRRERNLVKMREYYKNHKEKIDTMNMINQRKRALEKRKLQILERNIERETERLAKKLGKINAE